MASQLDCRELINEQHAEHVFVNYAWGNDSLMKVSPHSLELFCHALNDSS